MKKKLFAFTLALCLLLPGCAVQDNPGQTTPETTGKDDPFNSPEPMPGFDAQNQYIVLDPARIQEAGSILFGGTGKLGGDFMRYYDTASGVSGMMCPNPECTHDSPACGAYVEESTSICFYNGKRYWISADPQGSYGDYYLWRSDLSGENREKLKRISFKDVIMTYSPQWYAIHRGKLYFLGRKSWVQDGHAAARYILLSTPLDSSEEYTSIFDETYDRDGQITVRFVGNGIYCAKRIYSPDNGDLSDMIVTKYDRETGAEETLFEEKGLTLYPRKFWVTEDGTPYLGASNSERLIVWKLENGKKVEVLSRQGEDPWVEFADGIIECEYWKDGKVWAEILTLSGETLYDGWMYPNPIPGMKEDPNGDCTRGFLGGDRDKIIVQLSPTVFTSKYEITKISYTIMLDIRSGMKATVLWSNENW